MISARRGPMPSILRRSSNDSRLREFASCCISRADTSGLRALPAGRIKWRAAAERAAAVPEVAIAACALADDPVRYPTDLAGHKTAQPRDLFLAGWVVTQELVGESHCPQGQACRLANMSSLGYRQLTTASAQVDHQNCRSL